ncbi:GIY-YIG nuclease family protein [Nostoc sp. 'Peltigera membranacea cyanobiont' N6]|uniref:GIY-YIG nuclease family protein n=1 Tax=Nostoc sp. 'Peltigera membranacea cyanobiont' N6 TaxID=1261031 RepID=UPI000CF33B27|nr:excinuclease ABC subunit C [Nostoc sp. 'Peltigera membranacea cyanobiont' N6]AVH66941.1 GIY-YIG nuclease domain protein [Nostoc sp. 'Peltigera membranacea cyanobiont' N6]
MNANEYILQLPHISIKSRELLPENSGIYYVLDEQFIVWYVGQAKNLRSRWAGDSHHRLDQLQKQRKKQFVIYYELVAKSYLNAMERQRIEEYNPQLNGTKIKTKKLHPTETLLRETLTILAPYSFVLGVEPPRKQDPKLINDSIHWRDDWRVQKAVLPLNVIHVCINLKELEELAKDWRSVNRFLKQVFKQRTNYSDNWACKGQIKDEKYGLFFLRRLLVNGFAVEIYRAAKEALEHIQGYELTQLAGVDIRVVNEDSLVILKNKCLLSVTGIYMSSENQYHEYEQMRHKAIERLSPYKKDLIKLLFNEHIDTSKLKIFLIEHKTEEESNTNSPNRLTNLIAKKEYLKQLLIERGLDLEQYQVNKYLDFLPIDDNYVDSMKDKRMSIFVKTFLGNLKEPISYKVLKLANGGTTTVGIGNFIHGAKGRTLQGSLYKEVYLAATVDRVFWLLLESCLSDFTKVRLNEEEGYISKAYISARKFLVPAMLTVTLNGKWKADIPFGPKDDMSYSEVVDIIKSRLQQSGIPKLRFSFKSESSRT